MSEPRVLTIWTSGGKAKLDTSKYIVLTQRNPRKTFTEILIPHEERPMGAGVVLPPGSQARRRARVISRRDAAWWLAEEEREIPAELTEHDDRIDLTAGPPAKQVKGVTNYCLNCMRRARARGYRPTSQYEVRILAAMDEAPRVGRLIAELADLPFNSHFRATLSRLERARGNRERGQAQGLSQASRFVLTQTIFLHVSALVKIGSPTVVNTPIHTGGVANDRRDC